MKLPVMPPIAPMLAKAIDRIPAPDAVAGGLLYEPKWDGFRAIVFRDGEEVVIGSRGERPLTRYFPEIVEAARRELPERSVVDGEIVIVRGAGLDFDALLQRIHPAESRVRTLAERTRACFVAFDLLALGERSLMEVGFAVRRSELEQAVATVATDVHLTPATADPAKAWEWFRLFEGAGLDGVVAKPMALGYRPNERSMFKIKHERTADCVVAGFRWHKSGGVVGSLLLGLYGSEGRLAHVGVAASFSMARRRELVGELAPYREDALAAHPWRDWALAEASGRMPGASSRWNAGKDLSWEPLRPELVCEVAYDHMQGDRFRHATQFRRWRPDREPASCTYTQLASPVRFSVAEVFAAAAPRA